MQWDNVPLFLCGLLITMQPAERFDIEGEPRSLPPLFRT